MERRRRFQEYHIYQKWVEGIEFLERLKEPQAIDTAHINHERIRFCDNLSGHNTTGEVAESLKDIRTNLRYSPNNYTFIPTFRFFNYSKSETMLKKKVGY